jgi:hydroxyacylglutathione hydrolase
VPSTIGLEKKTNPFLRLDSKPLRAALNLGDAPELDVFAALRRRKDSFT